MSDILISIVIPTFNRVSLLYACLQSIQKQSFHNWECIIVDDYSTDNTLKVIQQLLKEDRRFRCIANIRSKGAQGARNTGILAAKGDWIAFNDSDDEWMPEKLSKQVAILKERSFNPALVIHSNCIVKDESKKTEEHWVLKSNEDDHPLKFYLKESSILFPSILTSKQALLFIGLLDEKVPSYQEWDTAIRLAKHCQFVHIKEPLFIYHKHKEETISKDLKRDIKGANYIRIKYREDFIEQFDEQLFLQYFLRNLHRIVGYGYWELGLKILKDSKLFMPAKIYWQWLFAFSVQADPWQGNKRVIKSFFRKIKQKIYG